MISELISPPPPSLSDDDDEEEEESESELEDSDDDFTRRGATAAAATAAADDDDTLSLDGKSSSSSSRKKKKPSPYPPALGARGGGWVLAQFVALFLVVFPPTAITLAIQVLGIFALLAGIALAAAGVGSIGVRSLSPFPVPRRSNQLSERGAYALVRHPMYGGLILFSAGAAAASASPGRAAAALLQQCLDLPNHEKQTVECVGRLLTQAPAWRITYSAAHEAARMVDAMVLPAAPIEG